MQIGLIMRHKRYKDKVKRTSLRYVLIDKQTNTATIHHFKTDLAQKMGISTRTLDRNLPYSSENWAVYQIKEVNVV